MGARLALAACVAALCALAASPDARTAAANAAQDGLRAARALLLGQARTQRLLTLGERRVYALQLGVYDSGELAQAEQQRLTAAGVPCVIWQGERMRIVCAAAATPDALEDAAPGRESYVYEDVWREARLRVSASEDGAQAVCTLLETPDALFWALCRPEAEEPLSGVLARAGEAAAARTPQNELCTQLRQSLEDWRALIERTSAELDAPAARRYAALTMATLCRELREVLLAQASEESAASAQRTPSTAAETMPPA